jgi:hypothetical protein
VFSRQDFSLLSADFFLHIFCGQVLFAKDRAADNGLTRADKGQGHACYFFYRAATWTNTTEIYGAPSPPQLFVFWGGQTLTDFWPDFG